MFPCTVKYTRFISEQIAVLLTLRVELQAEDYGSFSDATSKCMSNEAEKEHACASVMFFGHDLTSKPQENPSKRNVMTGQRNLHSQYPYTNMTEASSLEFEPPIPPPPQKKIHKTLHCTRKPK